MKTLILVLIVAIGLSGCKKLDAPRELPGERGTKIELPGDPELVNPNKDAEAVMYRKNNPHSPHGGGGDTTTQQPPPTTTKKACFLLDFDGYNVPAGVWSATNCAGSDFDATQIADIINRVRSYWAQFNVEITIDEARYYTYPVNKRIRCVITRTNFYGNVGGVAYINSLNWADQEKQCFAFCDLLQRNLKYNADAIAHELGHTVNGRHHVETRNDEYGICYVYNMYLWSDHIMGASYYASNPIFCKGFLGCGIDIDDQQTFNNSINQ